MNIRCRPGAEDDIFELAKYLLGQVKTPPAAL